MDFHIQPSNGFVIIIVMDNVLQAEDRGSECTQQGDLDWSGDRGGRMGAREGDGGQAGEGKGTRMGSTLEVFPAFGLSPENSWR